MLDRFIDTCDVITSAFEEEGTNRRMVTDLFSISGTAVDPALECFSKDGVEWFFHAKVKN